MDSSSQSLVHFAVIDDRDIDYVHSFFQDEANRLPGVVFNKQVSQKLTAGPGGNVAKVEEELCRLHGGAILAIDFELRFLNDRRERIREDITAIVSSAYPAHPQSKQVLPLLDEIGDQIDGFHFAVHALKEKRIERLLLVVATSRGNHEEFATILRVVGECLGRTPNALKVVGLLSGRSFSRTDSDGTAKSIRAAVKAYHDTWGKDSQVRLVADIWAQQAKALYEVFPQDKHKKQHHLNEPGFVQKFDELHRAVRDSVDALASGIAKHWGLDLALNACEGAAHTTSTCQPAGIAKAVSKCRVPLIWILKTWGVTDRCAKVVKFFNC